MTTRDDEAEALRRQLEICAAGHPVGVAWRAVSDHFAAIIGLTANDKAHAAELCDTAARDMRRTIFRDWDELCANRKRVLSGGHAGRV